MAHRMLRALSRAASLIALALAVLAGLVDAARTVAADRIVVTPMIDGLGQVAPAALDTMRSGTEGVPGLSIVVEWLLAQPPWGVFGVLAAIFWFLGRPRLPRHHRYIRR